MAVWWMGREGPQNSSSKDGCRVIAVKLWEVCWALPHYQPGSTLQGISHMFCLTWLPYRSYDPQNSLSRKAHYEITLICKHLENTAHAFTFSTSCEPLKVVESLTWKALHVYQREGIRQRQPTAELSGRVDSSTVKQPRGNSAALWYMVINLTSTTSILQYQYINCKTNSWNQEFINSYCL